MVEGNLLGIEAMTGHWEFTYGEAALRKISRTSRASWRRTSSTEEGPSTRQGVRPASGRVFKPSVIKEIGGYRIAVIGQAFLRPDRIQRKPRRLGSASAKRNCKDWSTRIANDKVDAVILLSHTAWTSI